MRKLVVMSNYPWMHVNHLEKLCQETGCQIEAFLCGKYTYHDGIFGAEKSWAKSEVYEKIGKRFGAKIVYNSIDDLLDKAKEYISSDVIVLAEIEYSNDWIYWFLQRNRDANNVVCMAAYEDSIILARETFEDIFEITSARGYDRDMQWKYNIDNNEGYQKLISMIKQ